MPDDNRTYLSRRAAAENISIRRERVQQYAALCVRRNPHSEGEVQVLLITSRGTGRWIIPKGWSMRNKKPHKVAEQEAWEEAGVRGKVGKSPFGFYTYPKELRTGKVIPSLVQVHMLEVLETHQEFPEKGQRELRWLSPLDAANEVNEPELRGLLGKLDRVLQLLDDLKSDGPQGTCDPTSKA